MHFKQIKPICGPCLLAHSKELVIETLPTEPHLIKSINHLATDDESDEDIDFDFDTDSEDPGDEFMLITKLKRIACLAHTVQLVYKDIRKISTVLS